MSHSQSPAGSQGSTPPDAPPPWWRVLVLPVATPKERRLRRRLRITLSFVVVAVAAMLLMTFFFRRPEIAAMMVVPIWLGGMGTAMWAVLLAAAHFQARRELGRDGYRVCPGCEYDLAALPERGLCPECGRAYDPESLRANWAAIYDALEKTPKSWRKKK